MRPIDDTRLPDRASSIAVGSCAFEPYIEAAARLERAAARACPGPRRRQLQFAVVAGAVFSFGVAVSALLATSTVLSGHGPVVGFEDSPGGRGRG